MLLEQQPLIRLQNIRGNLVKGKEILSAHHTLTVTHSLSHPHSTPISVHNTQNSTLWQVRNTIYTTPQAHTLAGTPHHKHQALRTFSEMRLYACLVRCVDESVYGVVFAAAVYIYIFGKGRGGMCVRYMYGDGG